MKKRLVILLLSAVVCIVGAFGLTACNDENEHSHQWSAWTVADGNKPTDAATGKATRTCAGGGYLRCGGKR